MPAYLRTQIRGTNFSLGRRAGCLRFDWLSHCVLEGIYFVDADGTAAGESDATAALFAAVFLAAFLTCESRRPWVAASRSRSI